jgi:YkoP domain
MTSHASPQPIEGPRLGCDHPWLGSLLEVIDRRLRERHGVTEYSRSADCMLRIQIIRSNNELRLSDGTRIRGGDRVVDLHLWNEHIPVVRKGGATLAWGRRMSRGVEFSLRELAKYLTARRDLDDVAAIRANMTFGSGDQCDQSARMSERYGFERAPARPLPSLRGRLHRFGENILISLMVIARNSPAFRLASLRRERTLVYLSRRKLQSRFGGAVPGNQFKRRIR